MLARTSFFLFGVSAIAIVACGESAPPPQKSPSDLASAAPSGSAPMTSTTNANDAGTLDAALAPAAPAAKMACDGATLKTATKEYCLMKDRRTFDQATSECDRMHARLAVLDGAEEAKAVATQIASPWGYGSALWLGCSDEEAEGKWKCNGKPLAYANWAPGKPDNETALDDCVEWLADSGQWNDASCAWKLGYVCRGDAKLRCTGAAKKITAGKAVFCAHGDDLRDWDGAKKACDQSGGKLAVLANADESRALFDALKLASQLPSVQPSEGVWIGLSDQKEEGKWRWMNDAPLAASNWSPSQPDDANGGEDCATMTLGDGKWSDVDCIRALPYLCSSL